MTRLACNMHALACAHIVATYALRIISDALSTVKQTLRQPLTLLPSHHHTSLGRAELTNRRTWTLRIVHAHPRKFAKDGGHLAALHISMACKHVEIDACILAQAEHPPCERMVFALALKHLLVDPAFLEGIDGCAVRLKINRLGAKGFRCSRILYAAVVVAKDGLE